MMAYYIHVFKKAIERYFEVQRINWTRKAQLKIVNVIAKNNDCIFESMPYEYRTKFNADFNLVPKCDETYLAA